MLNQHVKSFYARYILYRLYHITNILSHPQLRPYYRTLALARANTEISPQKTPRRRCNAHTLTPKGRNWTRLNAEESPLRSELQAAPRKAWASRLYSYSNTSNETQRSATYQDTWSLEDEVEAYLLDSQVTESSMAF